MPPVRSHQLRARPAGGRRRRRSLRSPLVSLLVVLTSVLVVVRADAGVLNVPDEGATGSAVTALDAAVGGTRTAVDTSSEQPEVPPTTSPADAPAAEDPSGSTQPPAPTAGTPADPADPADPAEPTAPTGGPDVSVPGEPTADEPVGLDPGSAVSDLTVTVSSNPATSWAVGDGNLATGDAGGTWVAATTDAAPSITLTWAGPRAISSVFVLGMVQSVRQANWEAGAPLKGTVVFADGSRIAVPGISGGAQDATVLAFPARTTTSVTLLLERNLTQATPGLRAFSAYGQGVTPPRWGGVTGPTYAVSAPVAAACPDTSASTAAIVLVCPATGTAVNGTAQVVLRASANPGAEIVGRAWVPTTGTSGSVQVVARGTVGPSGTVSLAIPTSTLTHGPLGVQFRFTADGSRRGAPQLNIQLYNQGGVTLTDAGHAPVGSTLVYDDEFTTPLSTSQWGTGSTYAATKPAWWGPSEFGEAVFANPAWGLNTLSTLEQEYLRIQAQPIGARTDPAGWGRVHESGLLSSQRVGGSGFSAQYGYFEARVLAPGGTGSWPAFWMLDGLSAAQRDVPQQQEVDAFELYGHDTLASCHTVHNWPGGSGGAPACLWPNGFSDWSLSWHTYGVQIRQGGADFYIDGQKVASREGLLNTDRAFFFMMNLSLGGGYPVQVDAAGNTLDLYVDWIRVYV